MEGRGDVEWRVEEEVEEEVRRGCMGDGIEV